ncbi:MAG: acyl-CoA dehydratase activase-related protein [Bifidobacteriaceae bacterium]|jgi:predicted CoA-substrate-specific enzyme activase|nr:acyl-CoA dehydratase activase-related protein [Bifidobacteriaceae bacterium]
MAQVPRPTGRRPDGSRQVATSPRPGTPGTPGPQGTTPETPTLRLGIDVGSTTVKAVLLSGDTIIFEAYRRHNAEIRIELAALLKDVAKVRPDGEAQVAVTGSAGLGVASQLEQTFVQEVIAETTAIQRLDPEADVIIELGGEDAKITYLKPTPEQRMNGTCAGGTGAFIDQMATLLHTDAAGLDKLAAGYQNLYPIASRCGVFAKSDLQPLLNEGAPHADLAASIFQAVATQTIAGLACGRPIQGRVVFLGGPLHFLPQLRQAFARALEGKPVELVAPDRAQLMVALGAAYLATGEPTSLAVLAAKTAHAAHRAPALARGEGTMRPLFKDDQEREEFDFRHAQAHVDIVPIEEAHGACFLGLDAGSTTIKSVVIDDQCRIVHSTYAPNGGDPVTAAAAILTEVRQRLPRDAIIAHSCVTGYGEGLIRAALHVDQAEVETMAHYRAAQYLDPDVTSVIDIGGQDMKYLRVGDGVIDSISVNEACSSGCGSFLQTFAQTMGLPIETFAEAALAAYNPVDLGSRCTVFMNSSVKQAQKDGATVGDISAGLSYSVVRNALYKVIKLRDAGQLGDHVVVQGGTFLNDAVLRAFELLTGLEVVRPNIAGLMGAFGAALIARARFTPGHPSRLLPPLALRELKVTTQTTTCQLCQNHCRCTISAFPDGGRHVSGNRCERGADKTVARSTLPNLYDFKYKRLFAYRRLTAAQAHRGDIGIPRALNMYENYPLWFTILTKLGFRVMISGRSDHDLFVTGMDSIASENICYPAKLAHGHIEQLIQRGITTIFYPSVSYERELVDGADNHFNCPVVTSYPQVIAANIPAIRDGRVRLIKPFLNLALPDKLAERLVEVFKDWHVTLDEAKAAVAAGYEEQERYHADVREAGAAALDYMKRTGTRGIVLAGRPYHVDPEVHHGIPELITSLGMVVLSEDAIDHLGSVDRPLRVRDQWAYHSRLYAAADAATTIDGLEVVQLNSFGCGLDAITTDQVADILKAKGQVYTQLKIDEVSNLGAARIRLRSLAAAAAERTPRAIDHSYTAQRVAFTAEMRAKHTIVAPQMSPVHFRLMEAAMRGSGYQVEVLETATKDDVELGLRHVNNDSCFPAIMVVGQLVNAFVDGRYDPDQTSVMITQTGGMCRATNYTSLLRKALAEAGYPQVPVVAISTQGLESNPGFKLTAGLVHKLTQAVVFGDLLQALLLRQRPYEAQPGSAVALYRRWNAIGREYLMEPTHYSETLGRRIRYRQVIRRAVREFDRLPVLDVPRKPRVGVVGEILVKFHPDANNHVVDVIEAEGHEAVVPGLMEFVANGMYAAQWNYANLGTEKRTRHAKRVARWALERYRGPVRRALRRARTDFPRPGNLPQMVREASEVVSLGNQAGEGWLLTAEILELIGNGVYKIICAQPFACLPNHVTGRGMFRELRRLHPEASIVSIDYDPGASEVNQLNRIKLLLAGAGGAGSGSAAGAATPLPAAAAAAGGASSAVPDAAPAGVA